MIRKRKGVMIIFMSCVLILAGCTGQSRAYFDTHPVPLLQAKQKPNGNNVAVNYEYCLDCMHVNDQSQL